MTKYTLTTTTGESFEIEADMWETRDGWTRFYAESDKHLFGVQMTKTVEWFNPAHVLRIKPEEE